MTEVYEILSEMGYTLKDYGAYYRTKPLYRDSNSPTVLSIRKDNGQWYDFKENTGGSFEKLIQMTLKLKSEDEAKGFLSKNKFEKPDAKLRPKNSPSVKRYPKEWLDKLLPVYDYWLERGVSKETLKVFGGGLAEKGQMANRYVFPIFDGRDDVVGFSGRDVANYSNSSRPKWKHIGNKSQWKYPLKVNCDIIKESKEVILVESIGDMLSLWEAGVKNVIVTFGLSLGMGLINFFLRYEPEKITISLNNDSESQAGNKAARKMNNILLRYYSQDRLLIKLPTKKDFGEMTNEEIQEWNV
jgi:hypothetical protein